MTRHRHELGKEYSKRPRPLPKTGAEYLDPIQPNPWGSDSVTVGLY